MWTLLWKSSRTTRRTKPVAEAQRLWIDCCNRLRDQVNDGVWLSTFAGVLPVALDRDELVLMVPSTLVKDRIEGRYRSLVADALRASGSGADLRVEIAPSAPAPDAPPGEDRLDAVLGPDRGVREIAPEPPSSTGTTSRPDEPLYTFEAFVIGPSNRFAHAAALAVAERPGRSYNPLFIYGEAGLGKTHLLQAIRHYVCETYPDKVVRYISTENFLNDFVNSIRFDSPNDFRKRWREVDVLLVDDIQFIERGEQFQEEFFHTFNELHDRRCQIVLTSDRPPDAIAKLEKRLRSRFMMGLITDIQPPDVETRTAILRKKAELATAAVPDGVLDFIAQHVTDNIRELEGALTRVTAYASLYEQDLTVELAERVLSDIVGETEARVITPQMILDATAARFGFTVEDIQGRSRRRPLVTARQIAMYVMRELTDLSFPGIAKEFGGRDHTTVMHAVEKISALIMERRQILNQVQALIQDIKKG
ncbi:MAG: chromosomal replication initiator protein DnaA [Actinobacteria bacterium]|nr:chromosomal replication initiator protein DnaA [Actinomycetota bacterium]